MRVTLHQRILSDVEHRILSGAWPPGYRIPSENELAQQYQCARMTINKAMTQLAKAGYIERRRRAGSFVLQPHAQSAVLEIHDIKTEVAALGQAYGYELIEWHRRRGDVIGRGRLELSDSAELIDVTCLHRAGSVPFCLEERLINLDAVSEAEQADFTRESPGAWLLRKVPWNVAEHTISAVGAGAATAHHLGIHEGAPCLAVERRTWNADHVVTLVRLTYPGDRHELVARFSPTGRQTSSPRLT